jgi:hypothetical protein
MTVTIKGAKTCDPKRPNQRPASAGQFSEDSPHGLGGHRSGMIGNPLIQRGLVGAGGDGGGVAARAGVLEDRRSLLDESNQLRIDFRKAKSRIASARGRRGFSANGRLLFLRSRLRHKCFLIRFGMAPPYYLIELWQRLSQRLEIAVSA